MNLIFYILILTFLLSCSPSGTENDNLKYQTDKIDTTIKIQSPKINLQPKSNDKYCNL